MGPLAAMYQLAQFAGPTFAACVVLTGILYVLTKLFASTSASQMEGAASYAENEHKRRVEAERQADKNLDLARWWCGHAHDQRLARGDDRHLYRMDQKQKGVEPLILPPIPELPPFLEDAA